MNLDIIGKAYKVTQCLKISNTTLRQLMVLLNEEFNEGLKSDESVVKMYISYVRSLPDNNEFGRYIALDLGGTNFRVILIDLNNEDNNNVETFKIPEKLMDRETDGELLFDFIAKAIITFTAKNKLGRVRIALGFTFSFPCTQTGLSQAKLKSWTKGFNCKNTVGKDVIKLLKAALNQQSNQYKTYIDIVALINDTTGTLMSCAHLNNTCGIGLIVGTGFNACYIEILDNIEKWPANYDDPKQVIINTEWGAFGDNGLIESIRTEWDLELDKHSINRGKQRFEKMVGGMYLGELVRLLLLSLIQKKLLFNGKVPQKLLNKDSFPTKSVSKVDSDNSDDGFPVTKRLMERDFDKMDCTLTDLYIIFMANSRVSRRAANLVSMGCATLVNRMNRKHNTIAYDGSVIQLHPFFKEWVKAKTSQLINTNLSFEFVSSQDGSGRGAAIVAAVCYKTKRQKIVVKDRKVYEINIYNH